MEVVKSKHQGRQYGTNFTLGDDKTPLVSSYYKDYIESKRRTTEGADSVKQVLAKPPQCARILLSKEQFPAASIATTTNRRDYHRDRGASSAKVYRERLSDLQTIKTLHMQNSVVFGPPGGVGGSKGGWPADRFLSLAHEHYRDPAVTARLIMKSGQL
ncbi:uncharacterized protein [Asterias amurensis]